VINMQADRSVGMRMLLVCDTDGPRALNMVRLRDRLTDDSLRCNTWFICETDWPMVLYRSSVRPFDQWICFIHELSHPCSMDLKTGHGR